MLPLQLAELLKVGCVLVEVSPIVRWRGGALGLGCGGLCVGLGSGWLGGGLVGLVSGVCGSFDVGSRDWLFVLVGHG